MLVFTMRPGQAFYVGDQRVDLMRADPDEVTIRTCGVRIAFEYDDGMHDLPSPGGYHRDIQVCARRAGNAVRIGVQAPVSVKILREALYGRARAGMREPARGPRRMSINDL